MVVININIWEMRLKVLIEVGIRWGWGNWIFWELFAYSHHYRMVTSCYKQNEPTVTAFPGNPGQTGGTMAREYWIASRVTGPSLRSELMGANQHKCLILSPEKRGDGAKHSRLLFQQNFVLYGCSWVVHMELQCIFLYNNLEMYQRSESKSVDTLSDYESGNLKEALCR